MDKGDNKKIEVFPTPEHSPNRIFDSELQKGWYSLISYETDNNIFVKNSYIVNEGEGYSPVFGFNPQKSVLGYVPEDENRLPITTWFKQTLRDSVQTIMLNSKVMREPSPPGMSQGFRADGSNLPWVVEKLKIKYPDKFNDWIEHLRTAHPTLEGIRTILREEDRHRYIMLKYKNGLEIPSWVVSDGTLRMLALTILAYIPDIEGTLLIEEPENGIHPKDIDTIFQSLSSVYNAQVLIATHSPIILGLAKLKDILCFGKTEEGAVDIVSGVEHPHLKNWKGEISLDVLFASGVLG